MDDTFDSKQRSELKFEKDFWLVLFLAPYWRDLVTVPCSVVSDYNEVIKKLQECLEMVRRDMRGTQEEKLEARYSVKGCSGNAEHLVAREGAGRGGGVT